MNCAVVISRLLLILFVKAGSWMKGQVTRELYCCYFKVDSVGKSWESDEGTGNK